VLAPKHRKWTLQGDFNNSVTECSKEIEIGNDFEIEMMETSESYVHKFPGFSLKYSIFDSVKRPNGASVQAICERYAEVKKELQKGEF